MVQLGADINLPVTNHTASLPLHLSCLNQNYNIAKFLLDSGVNVNAANNNKMTPLFYSLQNEHMIKLLFDNNADINHKDGHGDTPLASWDKNLKQNGTMFEVARQMIVSCGGTN